MAEAVSAEVAVRGQLQGAAGAGLPIAREILIVRALAGTEHLQTLVSAQQKQQIQHNQG